MFINQSIKQDKHLQIKLNHQNSSILNGFSASIVIAASFLQMLQFLIIE
jgi:hypothetical protein